MSINVENKPLETPKPKIEPSPKDSAYPNDRPQNGHRTPQSWHAVYDGLRVSEEEYWKSYYESGGPEGDASYEWNNGILEAKPMPNRAQLQEYYWFHEVLGHFLKVHSIAIMIFLETGFRMVIPDPRAPGQEKKAVRKPDIGVVLDTNEIPWEDDQRSYHGLFDLIVESLSDSAQSEIDRDTVDKKAEYEAAGVQEYYILDPTEEHQRFYRLDSSNKYVEIPPQNGLIQSEVLPGFQFRISDLLAQPTLEEMAQDEVYQGFMLPAYQEALRQLEAEHLRAEEEKRRADEAEALVKEESARNERLEQMLRDLGVDESELK